MELLFRHPNNKHEGKMQDTAQTTDSAVAMVTKASPPVGVSLASVVGFHVHDLILWTTLVYTVMMIIHKGWQMYRDILKRKDEKSESNKT